MTDPDQTPAAAPAPDPAPPATASAPATAHEAGHRWLYVALAVFVASLAFGAWGAWRTLADGDGDPRAQQAAQQARIDELEQRVATLTRSDQISRDANRDLQGALAERDEEISALRADVAFYERFVGSTAQRRGLTVHELALRPQTDQAWHYTATLTQNLNRGAISSGRLTLSIEGTQDGKLRRLAWPDLRQQPDAPGIEYSFKYFQQVEGDIMLPPGFQPLRISVRLAPAGAAAVEQTLPWSEATARVATGAGNG